MNTLKKIPIRMPFFIISSFQYTMRIFCYNSDMKAYMLLLLGLFIFPLSVFAAKPLIRTAKTTAPTPLARSASRRTSYSSAKLSRATNSVVVTFQNLEAVTQINYTLSYSGSGRLQGTGGTFKPSGGSPIRDLYFGTCSSGICTPHRYIKNAVLLVTVVLNNGSTHTKRYRIRV